jgi:hypothetical protein
MILPYIVGSEKTLFFLRRQLQAPHQTDAYVIHLNFIDRDVLKAYIKKVKATPEDKQTRQLVKKYIIRCQG